MKLKFLILFCILKSISSDVKVISPPVSSFIIGGRNAPNIGPLYECSVQMEGFHMCGCAIISDEWVITSAFCIQNLRSIEKVQIFIGSYKLNSGGYRHRVEELIDHEDSDVYVNDIGLIRLKEKIDFIKENAKPIELSATEVQAKDQLKFTGWGVKSGVQFPNALQIIDLTAISNKKCKKSSRIIKDYHLCTVALGGKGLCMGDHGGPLVHNDKLVGVFSFQQFCASGYPDIFTRISSFRDWIDENINGTSKKVL